MNGVLAGVVVGTCIGAALTALAVRWHQRRKPIPAVSADGDRDAVASQFASHAAELHRQIERLADVLAGDDAVLRERLRRFEPGSPS